LIRDERGPFPARGKFSVSWNIIDPLAGGSEAEVNHPAIVVGVMIIDPESFLFWATRRTLFLAALLNMIVEHLINYCAQRERGGGGCGTVR
jgi:hypothetical protein